MPERVTAPKVLAMKSQGRKVVCVTAYDAIMGAIADAAGVDLILVGDSMGNVLLGYQNTLPVSLEAMVHHVRATRCGVERALFVADLPFGTYQSSVAQAVDSSVELMKAGAEAVKLEGAYCEAVREIRRAGIPVMAHVGMTPQSVNAFGGHKVQGRGDSGARVLEEAKALEDAGAFSIVLELVPATLAELISQELTIPTIGIGAGPGCDGQIQVFHDLLGLTPEKLKHSKRYALGRSSFVRGLRRYAKEVRGGEFPTSEQSF